MKKRAKKKTMMPKAKRGMRGKLIKPALSKKSIVADGKKGQEKKIPSSKPSRNQRLREAVSQVMARPQEDKTTSQRVYTMGSRQGKADPKAGMTSNKKDSADRRKRLKGQNIGN